MTDPSADDVRRSNMATLASTHVVYIEAIRKLMGEDGLAEIGEANRLHGIELGNEGIKDGGLKKGDLTSIFGFFDGAHPFFGFDIELLEASDRVLEMKVTSCPWIDTFRAKGAGSDICHWVCEIDVGIGQAVDPTARMTLPKCMMRGDDYCIYRYETRK